MADKRCRTFSSAARYQLIVSSLTPAESPRGSKSPASTSLPTSPPAKLGATNYFNARKRIDNALDSIKQSM